MRGSVRVRPVALPAEHGGWGLLLEPIALGLLLAPSLAGLFLSVAAVGAFLARHPLKLTVGDRRRNRRSGRTPIAERFAVLYSIIAALSLAIAIKAGGAAFLPPLMLAAPIAAIQLSYDLMGRGRALLAELAGSIATGAIATAIAISGGWPRAAAFALWVIYAARSVPAILYLRARLRLLHHKAASKSFVVVVHLAGIVIVILLARFGLAPQLVVAAMVGLLGRAVIGFARTGRKVTAKKLGLCELCFGVLTVLVVIISYHVGR